MPILSPSELGLLRDRLQELQAALTEEIQSRREQAAAVEVDQTRVGRLSRSDAMQQQAMAQEANRRAEERLVQVRASLRQVGTDRYGLCLDCEEPIEWKRLLGNPCTWLCYDCSRERESAASAEAQQRASRGSQGR